ncbi:MAG: hypothetical protein K5880_04285 [Hydrogenophaga sp.]|jgi:hypothetical protein|uniref:hypothetical protein n=1 Tax=Hydrogenophaga sp. TaxID=1904254 RepID=UPI002630C9B1|nr:hypothetical protein [Hydrogenophaga sp.]MCV0437822.1 hypothetical protein [Hydrogenophaga sp.]
MKIATTRRLLLLGSVGVQALLGGCAALTSPKELPVIEGRAGQRTGALAVTAERRVILFEQVEDGAAQRICAEPSPDVAESLVSSIKAIAEASVKKGTTETDASLEWDRSLATAVSSLFFRSQGIQYQRDTAYALCQAYLNGALDKGQFVTEYAKVLNNAKELIAAEIPHLEARKAELSAVRAENARDVAMEQAKAAEKSLQSSRTAAEDARRTAVEIQRAAPLLK